MDPPRAGSTQSFMASAISLNPDRIVYISCNPETLARDLEFFKKHQYTAEKIQPVDMLGGGKILYIGNIIKNQFGSIRNWPLGAALSVMLIVITMLLIFIYTRFAKIEDMEVV